MITETTMRTAAVIVLLVSTPKILDLALAVGRKDAGMYEREIKDGEDR